MKTLKDFTPEIQDQIPQYIERALKGVFDGGRYNSFDIEKAKKAVYLNYERCGYKKPVVLVAGNPFEAQVIINYIKQSPYLSTLTSLCYQYQNNLEGNQLYNQLDDQLRNQLRNQLDDQLYNQLNNQLNNQLGNQLYNQLDDQLGDQLDDQLYNQLGDQLRNQLYNQLDDQLGDQLYNQLDDQLGDQLYNQLGDQLRNQLNNQLNNQLGNQLYNQLGNQLYNQLDDQLGDRLYNQLGDQLYNQLDDQLRNQLNNQLNNQLGNQLYNQLGNQLYNQLNNQLRNQLGNQLYNQLDDQLRNQLNNQLNNQLRNQLNNIERYYDYLFTLNVWSSGYFCWYTFIAKEFNINAGINSDLEIFSTAYEESGIYSAVFSEALCVVTKFPKRVHRDSENRLHCISGVAVEWDAICEETNFINHYIHGRHIPKNIAEVALNGELTKEIFSKENNDEYRSAWYNYLGEEKMLLMLGASEVDRFCVTHHNNEEEVITLFRTKENLNISKGKPYAWLKRICPSTGNVYLTPTDPDFKSAEESAKFHRPDFVPSSLGYRWYSRS